MMLTYYVTIIHWKYFSQARATIMGIMNKVYGEETSLRHVAIEATFLDDNKSKRQLKSGFALFQTSSISFKFI